MKISIITVVRNNVTTIEKTLLSVFRQSYDNIEYIVVDGKSTDGTIEIIEQYHKRKQSGEFPNITFRWRSEPDTGLYDAMNKGIALSTGDYIGIINSGDWYEDGIIERIVDISTKKNLPQIIHGKMNVYDDKGKNLRETVYISNATLLLKQIPLLHPTFFVHKKVYDSFGLFSLKYKVASDYDFSLRCYLGGVKFFYAPFVITNFCMGGCSSLQMMLGFKECKHIAIKSGAGRFRSIVFFLIKIIKVRIYPIYKMFFKKKPK